MQEFARSILNEYSLPKYFLAEAINTDYELWHGKNPNIKYLQVFCCKCFIFNNKEKLENFDSKKNVGIFLGYSSTSKAYRIFNKKA